MMLPPLYVGELNKKITFMQYSDATVDDLGQDSKQWTPVKTVWAQFRPIRGLETDEAARKFREERIYKAVIRYNPIINASFRIKYGDRLFEIISVLDPKEQHYKLEIECKEIIDRDIPEDDPEPTGADEPGEEPGEEDPGEKDPEEELTNG